MVSSITLQQPKFGGLLPNWFKFGKRPLLPDRMFVATGFNDSLQRLGIHPALIAAQYADAMRANSALTPRDYRAVLTDVVGLLHPYPEIKKDLIPLIDQLIKIELPYAITDAADYTDWQRKCTAIKLAHQLPVNAPPNDAQLQTSLRNQIVTNIILLQPLATIRSIPSDAVHDIGKLLIIMPINNREWCALLPALCNSRNIFEAILQLATHQSRNLDSKKLPLAQREFNSLLHRCLVKHLKTPFAQLSPIIQAIEIKSRQDQFVNSVLTESPETNDENMRRALPDVMFNQPPQLAYRLGKRIEHYMDHHVPKQGQHQFEAELMLFLRHPQIKKDESIDDLTRGITAITRFISHGMGKLSDTIIMSWGHIGVLAHHFRTWKYDAETGDATHPGLFTQYGFHFIPNRPTDSYWGAGYLISHENLPISLMGILDSKTIIEFRRTYILVSHPDHGTLIIRNASFNQNSGRSKLKHAAYYSEQPMSETDLMTLDPANDTRLKSILDTSLYEAKVNLMGQHLRFLLDQIELVKQDYQRWKFDTTFRHGEFQGHLSEGFGPLLDKWQAHANSTKPLAFAFIHPFYPPMNYYAYPSRNGTLTTYAPTKVHQIEMETYRKGDFPKNHQDLSRIDWFNFLQAGIKAHGELILIDDTAPSKKG